MNEEKGFRGIMSEPREPMENSRRPGDRRGLCGGFRRETVVFAARAAGSRFAANPRRSSLRRRGAKTGRGSEDADLAGRHDRYAGGKRHQPAGRGRRAAGRRSERSGEMGRCGEGSFLGDRQSDRRIDESGADRQWPAAGGVYRNGRQRVSLRSDGADRQGAEGKPKLPEGVEIGSSPAGKALKFQHRGTYDEINSTYEAITAYLDEKGLDTKNVFIEEYLTDLKPEDDGVIEVDVYVFVK